MCFLSSICKAPCDDNGGSYLGNRYMIQCDINRTAALKNRLSKIYSEWSFTADWVHQWKEVTMASFSVGVKVMMKEWSVSKRKSSREEGISCLGGRGGGTEGGQEREIQREREREMMGIIRIKMVGFGQSQVRATVSMPTSYPPHMPSPLNQLNWQIQGASMTHKQTTHWCTGNVPKSLNQSTKSTQFPAPDVEPTVMPVASDRIFIFALIFTSAYCLPNSIFHNWTGKRCECNILLWVITHFNPLS